MSFSVAEFQSVVDEINGGMDDIRAKVQEMPEAANRAIDHWYIPGFVADAVVWLCDKMTDLAISIYDKITEMLRGVAAPVYFWTFRGDLDGVVASANGAAAKLGDAELAGSTEWSGRGADAYRSNVPPQRDATNEVATQAEALKSALLECAIGGLVFYVGVGAVIVKFILAMVAAIAAFGSAVFSWAGAAIVLEEAGVNTAALAALGAALATLLGTQAHQMNVLQDAMTSDKFPDGRWPSAHNTAWNDGTVKDGDNDWSLGG